MNKSELIKVFSEKFEIGADAATDIVGLFFSSIKESLKEGERVEIRGFGSFFMKEYESYTGRNPKSGKLVEVKPKKLPFFKPGKALKDDLNQEG